jgi:hypothetical protein
MILLLEITDGDASQNSKRELKKGPIYVSIRVTNLRRRPMATDLQCPVCDADIPLEGDEKTGDLLLCSFCKVTFKMVKSKDKWILEDEFEE